MNGHRHDGGRIAACATAIAAVLATGAQAAAPTATPQRVLIIGDSMMSVLSHSLMREFQHEPGVAATNFVSLGSGLARLDAFDWLAKMRELHATAKPDTVILAIGANDKQALQLPSGVVQPGSPEWRTEYARRVGEAMDIFANGGVRRMVWLELPDMREPKQQADAQEINAIVREEAAKRPVLRFFETRALLGAKPGTFNPYVRGPDGMPVATRDPDGVHLSRGGADLLARRLITSLNLGGAESRRAP